MKTYTRSLIKKSYKYIVNGKLFPQSQKAVNDAIRKMKDRPTVFKCETYNNGKTTKRKIEVKGQSGHFTIS